MMLLIFLTTLITYLIKTFFISSFVMDEYYIKDIRTIFEVNISIYIEGLLHLLNNSLYSIYDTLNLSDYLLLYFPLLSIILFSYIYVCQIGICREKNYIIFLLYLQLSLFLPMLVRVFIGFGDITIFDFNRPIYLCIDLSVI